MGPFVREYGKGHAYMAISSGALPERSDVSRETIPNSSAFISALSGKSQSTLVDTHKYMGKKRGPFFCKDLSDGTFSLCMTYDLCPYLPRLAG